MTFTRSEDSPFDDSSALAEEYIPERLPGRDEELRKIEEVFQQIVDVEEPVNAFIYGISGTGKTVSVKYKKRDLEQSLDSYDDVHATFIYQNCESLSSSYQTAIAIANKFLSSPDYDFLHERLDTDRETLPSSGLPKERVYDILFSVIDSLTYRNTEYRSQLKTALREDSEQLTDGIRVRTLLDRPDKLDDERRNTILSKLEAEYNIQAPENVTDYVTVILDEVDKIGTRDELLYEIPRSRTNHRVSQVRPSVIGISNDIGYKESLQSKTDSSLRLREITFKKYDANQLSSILEERAEKAFKDGAYEEDAVVKLAGALARQKGGDARYGIDLLQKAGMKAKAQGDSVVRESHVQEAHEERERDRVLEVTRDLSDHEKLVLAGIMYHDIEGNTPINRGELYKTYRRFSEDTLDSTNSSRRVADYLKKLSQLGLLQRREIREGPGESGFVYSLEKANFEIITQVLGDSTPTNQGGNPSTLLPEELVTKLDEHITEERRQTALENWD